MNIYIYIYIISANRNGSGYVTEPTEEPFLRRTCLESGWSHDQRVEGALIPYVSEERLEYPLLTDIS